MSAEHAHRPGPDDAQSNGARVDSVSVSGFEMYYESWGAGRPLVLLHGAISTIEPSFGAVIPRVAQTRRLIAVEQQAHGRTADIERPLTYTQMAEDTATLVRKLKIDHADFFGYSIGSRYRARAGSAVSAARPTAYCCFPGLPQRRLPPRYRCAAYGNRYRWVKIGRERAGWRGPVHG